MNLERDGRQLPLAVWAHEILDSMVGICELLDQGDPLRPYTAALRSQQEKLADVDRTPSARLLRELTSTGEDFFTLARRMSGLHKEYILALPLPNEGRLAEFEVEARESLEKTEAIEATQKGSFEEYLAAWFERL